MIKRVYKFYTKLLHKRRSLASSTIAHKYSSTCITTFVVFILSATPAWAVQAHGGVEGLVTHQIGHFLFANGMGYLIFRLHSMRLKGTGWFEFRAFLWLIIAWNIVTFTGHWMNEFVAKEKIIKANGSILSFNVENFPDAIFYLTRLDHLILVPSFAFLLLALLKWSRR